MSRSPVIAAVLVVFFLGIATPPPSANADPTSPAAAACPSAWTLQPLSTPGTVWNELRGVTALSPTDAWAVGSSLSNSSTNIAKTLVEHWNGTSWSVVPSPNGADGTSELLAVDAASSTDVWAVGNQFNEQDFAGHTLAMHWNGSTWSLVPTPNASAGLNSLEAVSVVAGDDVWASGYYETPPGTGHDRPLTEHWDGTAWKVVPTISHGLTLGGLAGISSSDAWGVAFSGAAAHWDGASWSQVRVPTVGRFLNELSGATGLGSDDVWSVGSYETGGGAPYDRTLIEHYDGSSWSIVESPSPGAEISELTSVTETTPTDAWAVGHTGEFGKSATLIVHWDGTSWDVVPSADTDRTEHLLYGVSAAGGAVWAVGSAGPYGSQEPIVEWICPVHPAVTGFSPPTGTVGASVTVTGSGFTGASSVRFGDVEATFSVTSDTSITAVVPPRALTGPISVNTPGGTSTSASAFRVLPKINRFAPPSGPSGTLVTIRGSAFTGAESVRFGGQPATRFRVVSYREIEAEVPVGAGTGPITVKTPAGQGRSSTDFVVT